MTGQVLDQDAVVLVDSLITASDQQSRDIHGAYKRLAEKALRVADSVGYDQGRGEALRRLANVANFSGNSELALSLAQESLPILELKKNAHSLYRIHMTIANAQARLGDVVGAIESNRRAVDIAINESLPSRGQGAYLNLGVLFKRIGDYDLAMSSFLRSLEIAKEEDWSVSASLRQLGDLHIELGNMERALSYFQEAFEKEKERGDDRGMGYAHMSLAKGYELNDEQELAIDHLEDALASFEKSDAIEGRYQAYLTLGRIALKRKTFQQADEYLQKAKSFYEQQGNPENLAEVIMELANLSEVKKQNGFAIQYYKDALALAIASGDKDQQSDISRSLGLLYQKQSQYDSSAFYLTRHALLQDTLYQAEIISYSEEMDARFTLSEKESQIFQQQYEIEKQRSNNTKIGILALALFGLASFLFLIAHFRQKANVQLLQLDEARRKFFANISHELKTPISLIQGPLELAVEGAKNKTTLRNIELAQTQSDRLSALVEQIKQLSQIDDDRISSKIERVEIHNWLKRVVSSFESTCTSQKKHLRFTSSLKSEALVDIDISKLEVILNNLISNAIKYSSINSIIAVDVSELPNEMHIRVTDSGPGIDPKSRPKIFDRYYRDGSWIGIREGSGIGLSIVSELVEHLGGSISLDDLYKKGTSFILKLPVDWLNANTKSAHAKVEIKNEDLKPVKANLQLGLKKILIIEDNDAMANFLTEVLSPLYHCMRVSNGSEGLSLCATSQFDCITCDLTMPQMDGKTFIEKLRQRELRRKTPILVVTGNNDEDTLSEVFEIGVNDYLTKPFRKSELLARLSALINNAHLRKQNDEGSDEIVLNADASKMKQLENLVLSKLSAEDLRVTHLAQELSQSVRNVERIVKRNSGLTPKQFINEIRLQTAYKFLASRKWDTVAEVRQQVGYRSASYFARSFEKRFGIKPNEL